jgi:uncharacterized protein YndB with AHSA1/START domain
MTGMPAVPIVRIERLIAAPPDRVFAAWIDPARLAQWMSPVGHQRHRSSRGSVGACGSR